MPHITRRNPIVGHRYDPATGGWLTINSDGSTRPATAQEAAVLSSMSGASYLRGRDAPGMPEAGASVPGPLGPEGAAAAPAAGGVDASTQALLDEYLGQSGAGEYPYQVTPGPGGGLYQFNRETGDIAPLVPGEEAGAPSLRGATGPYGGLFSFDPATGEYVQQVEGREPPTKTLDALINQALIDGDFDKALAFDDFRSRPTASEALNMAMQFARSPADQHLISSIARGASTVDQGPFDPNNLRRVGSQPDFLVQAYNDYKARGLRSAADFRALVDHYAMRDAERAAAAAAAGPEGNPLGYPFGRGEAPETAMTGDGRQPNPLPLTVLEENANQPVVSPDEPFPFDLARSLIPDDTSAGMSEGPAMLPFTQGELREQAAAVKATSLLDRLKSAAETGLGSSLGTSASALTATATPRQEGVTTVDLGNTPVVENNPYNYGASKTPTAKQAVSLVDRLRSAGRTATTRRGLGTSPGGGGSAGARRPGDVLRFMAEGGVTDGEPAVVGENGPELLLAKPGSMVIPLEDRTGRRERKRNPREIAERLKGMGVRGMEAGGIIFGQEKRRSAGLPFGLQQLQYGSEINPSRGYLLRAANLRRPSVQALQNLTPESLSIFADQAALAGIPRGAFQQELNLGTPGGGRLAQGRIRPRDFRGVY